MKLRVLSMNFPIENGGDAMTTSNTHVGSLRSPIAHMNPNTSLAIAYASSHVRSKWYFVGVDLDFNNRTLLINIFNLLNAL